MFKNENKTDKKMFWNWFEILSNENKLFRTFIYWRMHFMEKLGIFPFGKFSVYIWSYGHFLIVYNYLVDHKSRISVEDSSYLKVDNVNTKIRDWTEMKIIKITRWSSKKWMEYEFFIRRYCSCFYLLFRKYRMFITISKPSVLNYW